MPGNPVAMHRDRNPNNGKKRTKTKKVYGPSKSQLKKLDLDTELAEIEGKLELIVRDFEFFFFGWMYSSAPVFENIHWMIHSFI